MNKNPYFDVIKFGAITIVVVIVMILVIMSQFTKMTAIDKEIEELNITYNEKVIELKNLLLIRSELPIYEKQLEDFNNLMPEKIAESDVSRTILDAAMKANIEINSIEYGEITPLTNYSQRSIIFGFSSSYKDLEYFLETLQESKKLVVIDSLDIKKNATGEKSITTQVTARMFQSTTNAQKTTAETTETEGTATTE